MSNRTQAIAATLNEAMGTMPVVDAHEHLPPEETVVSEPADVLTRLLCHYAVTSAVSAGMTTDRDWLKDTSVPLERRWAAFAPWLDAIADTGYYRAALIAARGLYGIERIDTETVHTLSARIQADNTPGLYDRLLKQRCGIERVLNQLHGSEPYPQPGRGHHEREGFFRMVYRGFMLQDAGDSAFRKLVAGWESRYGGRFQDARTLADFLIHDVAASGYVGIKFMGAPGQTIDDAAADTLFQRMGARVVEDRDAKAFACWLMDRIAHLAAGSNLPVALHCGLNWNCWQPVQPHNPMEIEPFLARHPDTRFDIYHGGVPWVRQAAVLANQYPNVHLNLCWCHQISPAMTRNMLNEWLDLVPVNKVIGFGGDNCWGPEKTYGVLMLARENIAQALARRIECGHMTEKRALRVCRLWLYENPMRIYAL